MIGGVPGRKMSKGSSRGSQASAHSGVAVAWYNRAPGLAACSNASLDPGRHALVSLVPGHAVGAEREHGVGLHLAHDLEHLGPAPTHRAGSACRRRPARRGSGARRPRGSRGCGAAPRCAPRPCVPTASAPRPSSRLRRAWRSRRRPARPRRPRWPSVRRTGRCRRRGAPTRRGSCRATACERQDTIGGSSRSDRIRCSSAGGTSSPVHFERMTTFTCRRNSVRCMHGLQSDRCTCTCAVHDRVEPRRRGRTRSLAASLRSSARSQASSSSTNPRSFAVSHNAFCSAFLPRCSRDITVPMGVSMISAISL